MRQSFRVLIAILIATLSRAEEPGGWIGPIIESIQTEEDTTALDVVNIVRAAIKKDKAAPLALRINVSDEELAKLGMKGLWLKNVPAVAVLKYVADQAQMEFTFREGMWVLSNPPSGKRRFDDNIVTLAIRNCTAEELSALGLQVGEKGSVTSAKGKKWPSEEWSSAQHIGEVLILTAYQWEIDCFNAALTLHRHGYRAPKMTSEQAEDANAEDAPE